MSTESRLTPAALLTLALLSGEAVAGKDQVVHPAGSLPTFSGPENLFTGQVDVEITFPDQDKVPYSGAFVTFQPGSRTAWHDHPAGQHMIVTKGTAITATRDGQVIAFHEGEAVWCPEDVDHWHGATPHTAMTHIVVTGSENGEAVNWKEKVTDAQYQAAVDAAAPKLPEFKVLSGRYQQLAATAAFAAEGDLGSLKVAINQALDNGVSINELKESFVHIYPYSGFPRSLNALATLMGEVEARKAAGKKDVAGAEPNDLPEDSLKTGTEVQTELVGRPVAGPLFDFVPVANTFLQKHLFGDVFARGVLNHQDREILTVAILAATSGTDPQLRAHIGMAMNTGLTKAQLEELATLLEHRVSPRTGQRVEAAIQAVTQ